jgi:G3E family GTPase
MFDTWSYTSFKPIQISLFNEILKNLPSTLFRAKGFIYAANKPEKPILFQLVGKRATLKPTGSWGENPPKTQLVFIGRHETVNFSAIENALMKFEQFKEEHL